MYIIYSLFIHINYIEMIILAPTIRMLLAPPGGQHKHVMLKSQFAHLFQYAQKMVKIPSTHSLPALCLVSHISPSLCVQVFRSSTTA